MTSRRVVLGFPVVIVLLVICAAASAAKGYPDRVGDVKGGAGPDIALVVVSNTNTNVTFEMRFAKAPPLRVNRSEGWIDMLLIGIDVPPPGSRPIPGGEWRGADYALGTHGPSKTGVMVRLGQHHRVVARFKVATSGSTLNFSIPRRALGSPDWFRFQIAAARELAAEGRGGGVDFAPARGTFRYALTG